MRQPDTTAAAVMVLEWAMTVGASIRLAADEGARLGVSKQAPAHVADALRRSEVRVQLATWMDGAEARWPRIWDSAGLLARTYITWRGSQRVQFSAAEIRQHDNSAKVQMADGRHAEELADFLAVGDIVRERDVVTAAAGVECPGAVDRSAGRTRPNQPRLECS